MSTAPAVGVLAAAVTLLGTVSCSGGGPAPDASPPPATMSPAAKPAPITSSRVFSPASPWNQPVPIDAPLGPAGNTYGAEIQREIVTGYGHASLNTSRYAPAVYAVPADQPPVAVSMWNCQGKAKLDDGLTDQLDAVPLPTDATIPGDSDAHVAVWQPGTDTLWEMWKTRKVDGRWQACWGGRLDRASHRIGTFDFPYGPTASGLSLLAGLITLDDLASGHIGHALALGVDRTRAGEFSWPANRTDGKSHDSSAIPEGQRLRLDPAVELDSLTLTPLGRMVAEALHRYGAIVRDTTVGAVTLYAQYPDHDADDVDPYAPFYGDEPKHAQFDLIPWDRLQALSRDYGKP